MSSDNCKTKCENENVQELESLVTNMKNKWGVFTVDSINAEIENRKKNKTQYTGERSWIKLLKAKKNFVKELSALQNKGNNCVAVCNAKWKNVEEVKKRKKRKRETELEKALRERVVEEELDEIYRNRNKREQEFNKQMNIGDKPVDQRKEKEMKRVKKKQKIMIKKLGKVEDALQTGKKYIGKDADGKKKYRDMTKRNIREYEEEKIKLQKEKDKLDNEYKNLIGGRKRRRTNKKRRRRRRRTKKKRRRRTKKKRRKRRRKTRK